jgi:hypothetical protein
LCPTLWSALGKKQGTEGHREHPCRLAMLPHIKGVLF